MNTNNKNNDPKNFKIPPKEPQFAPKNNTTPLPQKHVKNNETEGKDELDGCDKFIMNRCNEPPPCLTKIASPNIPNTIEGTPAKLVTRAWISLVVFVGLAYSSRYIAAPTDIGIAEIMAINITHIVP